MGKNIPGTARERRRRCVVIIYFSMNRHSSIAVAKKIYGVVFNLAFVSYLHHPLHQTNGQFFYYYYHCNNMRITRHINCTMYTCMCVCINTRMCMVYDWSDFIAFRWSGQSALGEEVRFFPFLQRLQRVFSSYESVYVRTCVYVHVSNYIPWVPV